MSNNKPFVRSNLVRYKSHYTNLIPKQFIRINVRHTRNISITTTRLDSSPFPHRFFAPPPKFLAHWRSWAKSKKNCACTPLYAFTPWCEWENRTRRLESRILTGTVEEKRFYLNNLSHSAWPWLWRINYFEKQTVSFRDVYVWGVNSTVTKHSDYFVWKDVTARGSTLWWHQLTRSDWILVYENTSFFDGVQVQKNSQNPRNALSDAQLISRFQNFTRFFKTALRTVLTN